MLVCRKVNVDPLRMSLENKAESEVPMTKSDLVQDTKRLNEPDTSNHHSCLLCDKKFSNGSNLNRHMRKIHNTDPIQLVPGTIICPLCSSEWKTYEKLTNHLTSDHSCDIETKLVVFPSIDEFENWKETVERETASRYIRRRHKQKTSAVETAIYQCHRSGIPRCRVEERKRSFKRLGSNKIGFHCPARITTCTIAQDCVEVEYVKTHVGHTLDMRRVPLTRSEKEMIARKILETGSRDAVLEELQRPAREGGPVERINLVTRTELINIVRDFDIRKGCILEPGDVVKVDEWIKTVAEAEEEIPVRFYKRKGDTTSSDFDCDDFLLVLMTKNQRETFMKHGNIIIVDTAPKTHFCDFEMISLFVVDDKNILFPVVFIFSNRRDEDVLKIAFETIKSCVGEITPSFFLSNDVPEVFSAWEAVFAFPVRKFIRNVKRLWKNKSWYSIKGEATVRKDVLNRLRSLADEKDRNTFHVMLDNLCKELVETEETRDFGTYFNENYANRFEMWASCYRPFSGLNTTSHIESMYKAINYEKVNGKRVKRLNNSVSALINYVGEGLIDRSGQVKGKAIHKIKTLRMRHEESSLLSGYTVSTPGNGQWQLLSVQHGDEIFRVEQDQECSGQCPIYCAECRACIHNYKCTCNDFVVEGNMCKHIHLVCTIKNNLQITDDNTEEVEMQNDVNEDSHSGDVELPVDAQLHSGVEIAKANALLKINSLFAEFIVDCQSEREVEERCESVEKFIQKHSILKSNDTEVFERSLRKSSEDISMDPENNRVDVLGMLVYQHVSL